MNKLDSLTSDSLIELEYFTDEKHSDEEFVIENNWYSEKGELFIELYRNTDYCNKDDNWVFKNKLLAKESEKLDEITNQHENEEDENQNKDDEPQNEDEESQNEDEESQNEDEESQNEDEETQNEDEESQYEDEESQNEDSYEENQNEEILFENEENQDKVFTFTFKECKSQNSKSKENEHFHEKVNPRSSNLVKKLVKFYKNKLDKELQKDKEIILKLLSITHYIFILIPLKLLEDKEFIIECIETNPYCYKYLSLELRKDPEIIKHLFTYYPFGKHQDVKIQTVNELYTNTMLKYIPKEVQNEEIIMKCLEFDKENINYKFMKKEYRNDLKFIYSAIDNFFLNFLYIPLQFKKDLKITTYFLKYNCVEFDKVIECIPEFLFNDKEFMIEMCKELIQMINYITDNFKNDLEFGQKIIPLYPHVYPNFMNNVRENEEMFNYYLNNSLNTDLMIIPTSILTNRDYLVKILKKQTGRFDYSTIPEEHRLDNEIIELSLGKAYFKTFPQVLMTKTFVGKYIDKYINIDHDFLLDPPFNDDKDLALKCILKKDSFFLFLSQKLKKDKEIITTLLKINGFNLQMLEKELRNDSELVLLSMNYCNQLNSKGLFESPLKYVESELKSNVEFVKKCIQICPYAIIEAPLCLKTDKKIVVSVLKRNRKFWNYLEDQMKEDIEVQQIYFYHAIFFKDNPLYDTLIYCQN